MKLGLCDHSPFVPSCEKLTLNANSAPRKPHSLMKRRFRGFWLRLEAFKGYEVL
jgi:hypothetical protein